MWVVGGESRLLVGIVGGKLQGVEAAYLARKAEIGRASCRERV